MIYKMAKIHSTMTCISVYLIGETEEAVQKVFEAFKEYTKSDDAESGFEKYEKMAKDLSVKVFDDEAMDITLGCTEDGQQVLIYDSWELKIPVAYVCELIKDWESRF